MVTFKGERLVQVAAIKVKHRRVGSIALRWGVGVIPETCDHAETKACQVRTDKGPSSRISMYSRIEYNR